MKKVLTILLALIMVLGLCAVTASAEADFYDPNTYFDLEKSKAGSEISTICTFKKLIDGKYYGDMAQSWHSETGSADNLEKKTLTVMFKNEIEVGGIRIYPRTKNGTASPGEIKVIGIYKSGEKEIATANLTFEVVNDNDIAEAPATYMFPENADKKLLGLKLVVLKGVSGIEDHTNFTELEILRGDGKGTPPSATTTTTTTTASGTGDAYKASEILDMEKSKAGSEISTICTFKKLIDGKYYGDMADSWHSETGSADNLEKKTLTLMFKNEIEVGGIRIYPRTKNGTASPGEIKVIGIYKSGEKEIATANLTFEVVNDNDIAEAPATYMFPENADKKLLGLKLVVLKGVSGIEDHTNFTELEILKAGNTSSAPQEGTTNPSDGGTITANADGVYKNSEIIDTAKSKAGSEINTVCTFKKLIDGQYYGKMGDSWHSEVGVGDNEEKRTLTFMFKNELEVLGFKIYPRTVNGWATPASFKIIGIYKSGEKEINNEAYVNFETIEVANLEREDNVPREPASYMFEDGVDTKLLGIKLVLLKTIVGQNSHFNFTEIEFIGPEGAKEETPEEPPVKVETEKYTLVIGSKDIVSLKGTKTIDVAPYIDAASSSTLIPLRGLLEDMGAEIGWDGENRTITITKGEVKIVLQIGSTVVRVDGKKQYLPVAPVITESRTFIPVRFVSEVLGYEVGWEGTTKTITITK